MNDFARDSEPHTGGNQVDGGPNWTVRFGAEAEMRGMSALGQKRIRFKWSLRFVKSSINDNRGHDYGRAKCCQTETGQARSLVFT